MRKTTKIIVLILVLAVLGAVILGMVWHRNHYVMVDFTFYAKDTRILDLRSEDISVSKYNKLRRNLPDCEILWNVPFQDSVYPNDITELTVSSLSQTDVEHLACFPELKTLRGENCTDYAQLLQAAKQYPQLQVTYQVSIGGSVYDQDTRVLSLPGIAADEIPLLDALPRLSTVALSGMGDGQSVAALQEYCSSNGVNFCITLGDSTYSQNTEQLTVTGITTEQLEMLTLMPHLKKLHMHSPAASPEAIESLHSSRPDLKISWDVDICGKIYDHTTVEVDLSDTTVTSIEEVEQAMAYLPDAEHLFLGFCGLDNEEIAAYRERSRELYKVVWVVDLSGKMQVRTDIDNFMPSRDGWGYVRDHEVDNIRYCEDLICIDLGHMGIKDVSFLEPLVNLEYLILAHTEVQYIDAIANCKKLKFLELDWSCVRDVSPLVECTALEDLNLGMTWPDITPILEMTWLKNLYLIKGNTKANFAEALPNTRVVATGDYTVSNGWRNLPNYYAMRDILGMYYM